MAITVNGKKVAGVGPAGLSPYQVAKAGGYTGSEQEFNEALAKLNELFSSVSEGKALIAAAVTDKGVETAADATFQQIADNVEAIPAGGSDWVTTTLGELPRNPIQTRAPSTYIDSYISVPLKNGENALEIYLKNYNIRIFKNDGTYGKYGTDPFIVNEQIISYSNNLIEVKIPWESAYSDISISYRATNYPV